MVARPAKMYGLETRVLTRRQVAELKIRGFLMRVTRMGRFRNECIRGTAEAEQFKKHKVRGKVEIVWTETEEGIVDILGKGW